MLRPRWLACLAPIAGLLLLAAGPVAAVTLQAGGAVIDFDGDSREGLSAWTVDGVVHLRQQGWWVRVAGDPAETSFADLDLLGVATSDSDLDGDDDHLVADFADPAGRFVASLDVQLSGILGSASLGSASDLVVALALTNTGVSPLDITLFQYTDVDLFGSFSDDSGVFSNAGAALAVNDSSGLGLYAAAFATAPDAVEAQAFDGLLQALEDGLPTALSGALSISGDVTAAVSWTRTLGLDEGFSLQLDQAIRVDGVSVPEPGTWWLLGSGLVLAGRRRRR